MASVREGQITALDVAVLLTYFVGILSVGLVVSKRTSKTSVHFLQKASWKSQRGSLGDFFLTNHKMHWALIGAQRDVRSD